MDRLLSFEPLLTVQDLATYLGVPKSWIYENNHEIPHMKIRREYRYRASEVNAWLETTRGGTPLKYLDVA